MGESTRSKDRGVFPHLGSAPLGEGKGIGPEAQLAALTQAQAIAHFDLEGTILGANQNFLSVFGYALSEVQGRHHSMLVPDEEAEKKSYRAFWANLAQGKHQTASFKRLGKGGREIWIQASYIPVSDEHGPVGVVKYAVEVTKERLTAAENHGQIEAIRRAHCLVEFALDGTIVSANELFLELVGYSAADLVGQHHAVLVTPEEKATLAYESFWRRLRSGKFQRGIYTRVSRDGSLRHIQAAYSPILDMEGRPFKVVKYATDVTKQVEMEKELVRAKEQALAASASKSMFLATMSHEIRTPMNGVIAASDLLRSTQLDEEQAELCEIIKSSGESLLALINDILDFSKLEAGKVTVHPEAISVHDLLQDVERLFSIQMREKGLEFSVQIAESVPPWLNLDPLRLRQVMVNLIGNALKFTGEGYVTVSCDYQTGDKNLFLRIADSGVGIATPEKLFQDFSQEDSSRTRKYGGTGLGLAVCKRLIELMAGAIEVSSEVDRGTEFFIRIRTEEPAEPPQAAPRYSSVPLPSGKACVVDDNHVNRVIATRMLSRLSWESVGFATGAEALAYLAEHEVDVVLMDCQMPQMDGFETTRRLRKTEGAMATVPVLALTASVQQEERDQCRQAGMNGFLSKPVRLAELKAALMEFAPAVSVSPFSRLQPTAQSSNDTQKVTILNSK